MRILLSGGVSGSNVGGSIQRAALASGHQVSISLTSGAFGGPRWWRVVSWRFLGRRPPTYRRYQIELLNHLRQKRPDVFITTGVSPVGRDTIRRFRDEGVRCVNYSTDDPWNPVHRGRRFLDSIPEYDHIGTPRKANIVDFIHAGARRVSYVPFAYDPSLIPSPDDATFSPEDVVFVGGGDRDRINLLTPLAESGISLAIYGSYWGRLSPLTRHLRGQVDTRTLSSVTRAAKINICAVRRANRDDHVMRSYEIAALGGFVLAEDTGDHRELYGDTAGFFRDANDLLTQTRFWLERDEERNRLAHQCRERILQNSNRYADRLAILIGDIDHQVKVSS